MLLRELFDSGGPMKDRLRQAALDVITPFLGQNVPFVTVHQVIDALRSYKFGLQLNRGLVLELLDPEKVKAISKIEGDRIYLAEPDAEGERKVDDNDEEKDKEQVGDMAQDQAKQQVQGQDKPPPPAPK
jgi:hypothetical protein